MNNLSPKFASQITEPGAYKWVDRHGVSHVGFVYRDKFNGLTAAFVSEVGDSRAVGLNSDDDAGKGLFYGPLSLPE